MSDRPRRTSRRLGGTAAALLALVGLVVTVSASESGRSGRDSHLLVGQGRSGGAAPPRTFSITGTVAGLSPGRALPLVLTVTNPQRYAITVASISTTAGNASSSCPAADVTVSAFAGQLPVGAGRTVSTTVTVTMRHSAPDGCQAAVFPFRYTGAAARS